MERRRAVISEFLSNYIYRWDRWGALLLDRVAEEGGIAREERGEFFRRPWLYSEEMLNRDFSDSLMGELSDFVEERLGGVGDGFYRGKRAGITAYFCAEFGVDSTLPIYAGGLGVLAGDHCKSASDLGLDFIGVGLWYTEGYFSQKILPSGEQRALYRQNNRFELPLREVEIGGESLFSISIGGEVFYRAYYFKVGKTVVYLLDSDLKENSDDWREICQKLYGTEGESRLRMELFLGFAGIDLLNRLGIEPNFFHLNEGHTSFVSLGRLRKLLERGEDWKSALSEIRKTQLFTTHTPVPAGHDRFSLKLAEKYLSPIFGDSIDVSEILKLGLEDRGGDKSFCMTLLGFRTSNWINGVSELHRRVTVEMWRDFLKSEQRDIGYITNGIHVESWIAPQFAKLFDERLGEEWRENLEDRDYWELKLGQISDREIWRSKLEAKRELFEFVAERLRKNRALGELSVLNRYSCEQIFAIGFARRFAAYKRADLLFSNPSKLAEIVNNPERPVVIFYSGKAHPRDKKGQSLLKNIALHLGDSRFRGKVFLVEDYDLEVAKKLVWGVDLWLNNPLPTQEASGTSGQKVICNFGLNFSVPDGWWWEVDGDIFGWNIGKGEVFPDLTVQNRRDSEFLYRILELKIIPLYYKRDRGEIPRDWIAKGRRAFCELLPRFNSHRMVREYLEIYHLKLENSSSKGR